MASSSSSSSSSSSAQPVDYFIVGLGNPDQEYIGTRHNAGYIFIDYLAHLINFKTASSKGVPVQSMTSPVFTRFMSLGADVCDMQYTVPTNPKPLRLLLIKPITGMNDSGSPVGRILVKYNCTNIPKQVIVVFDDLNTLPGAVTLQNGGDLRAVKGHGGVENIAKVLKTNDFIRFRIGINRPPTTSSEWSASGTKNKVSHQGNESMSIPNWVLSKFSKENKEMDLVGYSLEILAQALGHFAATGDLKATKKKYCSSKKIPNNLKKYESLSFPVIIGGL